MTIDVLSQLAEPFAAASVKWRIGSTNGDKTRGMALAYIDARCVFQRLDDVVGSFNWQSKITLLEDDPRVLCSIGIRPVWEQGEHDRDWVWKTDGAGPTDIEGEKGGISDAIKRAAVHWGIARYLYEMPAPWVAIERRGRSAQIAAHERGRLVSLLDTGVDPGSAGDEPASSAGQSYRNSGPEEVDQEPPEEGVGSDDFVSKSELQNRKVWPRLFKLNENEFGKGDNVNKFQVADKILKHIGVGKMSNVKYSHLDKLLSTITHYENTGSLPE